MWTESQPQIHGYEIPIKNVTGNANEKIQNKNLFDINKVNDFALSSTIVQGNSYRGYTLSVNSGEKLTISRKQIAIPNRFRACFTKEEPANNVDFYDEGGYKSSFINLDSAISGTVTVPTGMNYLFVYPLFLFFLYILH